MWPTVELVEAHPHKNVYRISHDGLSWYTTVTSEPYEADGWIEQIVPEYDNIICCLEVKSVENRVVAVHLYVNRECLIYQVGYSYTPRILPEVVENKLTRPNVAICGVDLSGQFASLGQTFHHNKVYDLWKMGVCTRRPLNAAARTIFEADFELPDSSTINWHFAPLSNDAIMTATMEVLWAFKAVKQYLTSLQDDEEDEDEDEDEDEAEAEAEDEDDEEEDEDEDEDY